MTQNEELEIKRIIDGINEITNHKQDSISSNLIIKKLNEINLSLKSLTITHNNAITPKSEYQKPTLAKSLSNDLLNLIPDAIVGVNDNSEIILFNDKAETLFGYTTEEITGKNLDILIPHSFHVAHHKHLKKFFSHPANRPMGNPASMQSGVKKDGTIFPLEISLNFLHTENGIVAVSSIRDISEKKNIIDGLLLSKNELDEISNSIPGVVFRSKITKNNETTFLFFNKRAKDILGIDPEKIISDSSNFFSLIHPDDIGNVSSHIDISNSTGEICSYNFRIITKDHKIKWLHSESYPKKEMDGTIFRYGHITDITTLKLYEQELALSKHKYKVIVETTDEMINTVSPEGKILWTNSSWQKNLLYSADEAKNLRVPDILDADQKHGFKERLQKLYSGESLNFLQTRFINKSGEVIHAEGTVVPIIENDKVIGTQGFFRNITDKVKVKEQHQKTENLLQRVLGNLNDGRAVIAHDWTVLYNNEAAQQLWSEHGGCITGKNLLDVLKYEKFNHLVSRLKRCINEGHRQQFEEEHTTHNGNKKWYGYIIEPFDDGIFIQTLDITKNKEAQILLSKSEQNYKRVIDNINDGLFIDDTTGKIIFVNNRFLELFGYEAKDMAHMTMIDFIAPEYHDIMASRHKQRFAGGKVPDFYEFLGMKKDGTKRWFEIRVSNIMENGKLFGVQATLRDITEIKTAREQIEKKNIELKKTNSELDKFVYSTSHDLRGPLLSILGLVELGEDSALAKEEINNCFGMMKHEIMRIDNIIKEILDYSKNERLEMSPQLLDANQLINKAIENNKYLTKTCNISIKVETNDAVPFYSDTFRFSSILNNLISNAIIYQKRNSVDPFISIRFTTNNDEGILEIEDNGEGIEPANWEKIFEMFSKVSVKSTGSGLGLYICKEMVNKLSGSITVSSQPGKGSIFTITLPNCNSIKNQKYSLKNTHSELN